MASQPKVGEKKMQQMQFCSVYDQQKSNTNSKTTLKEVANFDFLSNETKEYIEKWNTYTFNTVAGAIEMIESSQLGKDVGKIENLLNETLNKVNNLPDSIIKIFQQLYAKLKTIIVDVAVAAKSKVSQLMQKIVKLFEVTLVKVKNTVIGLTLRAIVSGHDKIADLIIGVTEKVIMVVDNIKLQLSRLERFIFSLVKNSQLSTKLRTVIDTVKDVLSTVSSSISTKGVKLIGGIEKFLGKFALAIDVVIKGFKTIRSAFDSETDFSDSGLDSFWYNLAALIVTVVVGIVGILLVKAGFVIAAFVLGATMIGLAIYEIVEGIDLLALSLAEPFRILWQKINELYEDVKQKVLEIPSLIDSLSDAIIDNIRDYSGQLAKNAKAKLKKEAEDWLRDLYYKYQIPTIN